MGKYTVVSRDAFDELQLDAGVILTRFNPANPVRPSNDDILATTSGGINPVCQPTYSDLFEDVDNAPANTIEGKHLDSWLCTLGFTSIKFNAANTKWALGAADQTAGTGYNKIVPRRNVKVSDYKDLWWVGDKANGGAFAIRLMNALSTGGISIQTNKNGKGTNAMTLTGHVSMDQQDVVPMEFYDIEPTETSGYYVKQDLIDVTSSYTGTSVDAGDPLSATLSPASGMELDEVTVTMGGVDITDLVYNAGSVSIASVTGNVIITANAVPE